MWSSGCRNSWPPPTSWRRCSDRRLGTKFISLHWCYFLSSFLRLAAGIARLTQRWLPSFGPLIAFGLVYIIGHRDQLGVAEIVGKTLAAGCCPWRSAGLYNIRQPVFSMGSGYADLPCVGQWNKMVDINVTGERPCCTVVGAEPAATRSGAGWALYHPRTIALQHHLSSITCPWLNDPVGEKVPAVAGLRALRSHDEGSKLAQGGGRRGNIGGCRSRSWESNSATD